MARTEKSFQPLVSFNKKPAYLSIAGFLMSKSLPKLLSKLLSKLGH